MTPLEARVLAVFKDFGKDELDLHALFEAEGNDRARDEAVLFTVDELVRDGFLESRGNDFYALTAKGKEALPVTTPRRES